MNLRRSAIAIAALTLAAIASQAQSPNTEADNGKVAAKSAWLMLTPEQKTQTLQFADPYKDYLRHAKSAASLRIRTHPPRPRRRL
jgi:hypothetical protein